MTKWVYSFSAERAEGRGEMKNLLGGKGANLHEMASSRPAGASRLHHHHRGLHLLLRQRQDLSARSRGAGRRRGRRGRPPDRPRLRRRGQSAAGLGALGRARLDAGHDGHRPQPRPERRIGRDARQDVRRRALRLRQLSPLHPDVFERRARRRQPQLRGHPRALQGRQGLHARHRPQGRRLAQGHRRIQGQGRGGDRQALPAGAEGSALGRDRRGLLVLDEPARDHLSPPQQHSRPTGAPPSTCRRWCSATWARPRRPASPSPAIRRPARTRSTASSWSTPRARTWWPASARRRTSPRSRARPRAPTSPRSNPSCPRCSTSSSRRRNCSRSTTKTCRTWSSPSSAASSGCCRPATASAPRKRR